MNLFYGDLQFTLTELNHPAGILLTSDCMDRKLFKMVVYDKPIDRPLRIECFSCRVLELIYS